MRLLFLLLGFTFLKANAQDTLFLSKGDIILGEIAWKDKNKVIMIIDGKRVKFKTSEIKKSMRKGEINDPLPVGSDVVTLHCDQLAGKDLYLKIGNIMKSEGLQFESTDSDFFTIDSKPVRVKNGDAFLTHHVSVSDSSVSFRGKLAIGTSTSTILFGIDKLESNPVIKPRSKAAASTAGWNDMFGLAMLIRTEIGCQLEE